VPPERGADLKRVASTGKVRETSAHEICYQVEEPCRGPRLGLESVAGVGPSTKTEDAIVGAPNHPT
jgi:hypothetical protein